MTRETWKRTLWCGDLRREHMGQEVVVAGWCQRWRDHGGVVFIDMRDRTGLAQIVFEPTHTPKAHEQAHGIRNEYVFAVRGKVRERPEGMLNEKIPTGEVEVLVDDVAVFSASDTLPFQIEDELDTSEEVRLRYRYLDLRRPVMQENFARRARACLAARNHLAREGFMEVETPFMTKYTPGGARNYLVPSRVSPGSFYALAESPQIFKQLLMVSGFDRYYQIVRCFRDEDLRADRQPEFTQIDVEMSFADEDDVMQVVEGLLASVWREVLDVEIPTGFQRLSYAEAMSRYGSDKPDLRFDLPLADVSQALRGCGFGVFDKALDGGGSVFCLRLPDADTLTRKDLDDMPNVVKPYGGRGVAWVRLSGEGEWSGVPAKYFGDETRKALLDATGAQPGDLLTFLAGPTHTAQVCGGALRLSMGRRLDLIDESAWCFCWVHDFPLFEKSGETGLPQALHHPFTSPRPEDVDEIATHPWEVRARAYDVVLNGIELGGGSVRIHDPQVQARVFEALGMSEEDARRKFGFLLDAFSYGAPPHAGIALGVDRLAMLLSGARSLRDVIAFPKTQRATDLMVGSPSPVSKEQLEELRIRVIQPKKT